MPCRWFGTAFPQDTVVCRLTNPTLPTLYTPEQSRSGMPLLFVGGVVLERDAVPDPGWRGRPSGAITDVRCDTLGRAVPERGNPGTPAFLLQNSRGSWPRHPSGPAAPWSWGGAGVVKGHEPLRS